jgi:hypothetical protein
MKKKVYWLVVSLIVPLTIFFGVFFYKALIMRSYVLFNFIFTPKDYWQETLIYSSNLEEVDIGRRVKIKAIYPGRYSISAYVETPIDMSYKYKTTAVFQIKVFRDDVLLHNYIVDSKGLRGFWGHNKASDHNGTYKSGFTVMDFDIPKDWKKDEVVDLEVSVMREDSNFHAKYGPVVFFFEKESDE